MTRSRHPVLSLDQLNRATLARQLLLDRSRDGLTATIERIGGLQAQEPASPYIGLWSRLVDFDPVTLDRAFRERRVVKATLVRATLHVVSRADYERLIPAVLPILHGLTRRDRGGGPPADALDRLAAAAADYAAVPRSNVEMRDHVGSLVDGISADDAWWWVVRHVPFVRTPSAVPWSFGRTATFAAAVSWLRGIAFSPEPQGIEHLVRRYLGAFGPASAADVAAWSGLAVSRFRPAIAAIDGAGDLRRFWDEAGRELIDLVGAPLPDPRIEAPPRLLPMWDSVLLAHANRSRILSDQDRALVIGRNGDTLPTFLVDGRVAGLWWAEAAPSGESLNRIVLEPFRRLDRGVVRELEREGARLAAMVGPREPTVYRRYRASRARRLVPGQRGQAATT